MISIVSQMMANYFYFVSVEKDVGRKYSERLYTITYYEKNANTYGCFGKTLTNGRR